MKKRPLKKARLCPSTLIDEEDASPAPPSSSWNLLSSLPDLVLAHVLTLLLPPSHGVRVLPSHRRVLFHAAKAFLKSCNDPAVGPDSFWHDETDQYGQNTLAPRLVTVLALRATCRALRDGVDLVLRIPPLAFVDQLHAWLGEHLGGGGAPAIDDVEAGRRLTQQAAALTGRAHALLHQLRLVEVVDEVCQEWEIGPAKRRALARLTRADSGGVEGEDGEEQPRLRMVHFAHRSGSVDCQAVDASLTLSLPGQPNELVELSLVSELIYVSNSTVFLALHTRSAEWCRRLGLDHPTAHEEQVTTRALVGWSLDDARLHTGLLAKLWRALGFACKENRDDDGENGDELWRAHEVAVVLLGCLGFMSRVDVLRMKPFDAEADEVDDDAEDDEARELADAECVECTTSRFDERRSMERLVRDWSQVLCGHVAPLAGLGRRQALTAWELAARTVERYVGQLRVSQIGQALAVLHGLPPGYGRYQCIAHVPPQVWDSVRVLGCQSFAVCGPRTSGHTHICTRFALSSPPAINLVFRCELSSCEDDAGIATQFLLITVQACAPDGDGETQELVKCMPYIAGYPHGGGPRATVATQTVVQVGRALGMTPDTNTKATKDSESENENESESEDEEPLDEWLEEEGAREEAEFARQVASALMFVAQLAAWNGRERFGDDEEEELNNDEFDVEDAIGRAPLPRLCFTGKTWAYW